VQAPRKVWFSKWLAFHGRCWMSNIHIMFCGGIDECALCVLETLDHLLTGYVHSRDTWFQVIGHTSVLAVSHCWSNPPSYMWWLQARKTVAKGPHKGFDALVRLIEWSLWKKRNRRIHEGSSLQSVALAPAILEEG
jgi:hypothetical protein